MTPGLNKKDRRQIACLQRAASARFYAKVLMPITAIVFSTALWSDPVIQPQLQQKIDDFRPMVETALDGGSVDEILAAGRPQPQAAADQSSPELAGLPGSQLPVNRPEPDQATN
ncbi:hypothetical protein [Roseobacter sp.]|uniref:hypothetical protein n=1 Tax=Roseobacter sp. TaxID=1907202 RepID=UPI0025E6865D|nr:hypothetical protein [Roseobacter sp.]